MKGSQFPARCPRCGVWYLRHVDDVGWLCDHCCVLRDRDQLTTKPPTHPTTKGVSK